MYRIVLIGPTGDHDSLRQGLVTSRRGGQPALHLGVHPDSRNAHHHSWNLASKFLVPRGTDPLHKGHDTKDRDVNKEDEDDGAKQRMTGMGNMTTKTKTARMGF